MPDRLGSLKGISFPFRKERNQFPAVDIDVEAVKSDLILLFNTPLRSRIMRPSLGTDLHNLLFDPIDDLLIVRMQSSVRQTILNWEPRINILSVLIEPNGTLLTITVEYSVKGVRDSFDLTVENAAA